MSLPTIGTMTASPPSLWPGGFLATIWGFGATIPSPPIVFDASVRESHDHQWSITSAPIETGAQVTDHVQAQPRGLIVDVVFVDEPDRFEIPKLHRARQLRSQLIAVAETRVPFDFVTGLEYYPAMVFSSISTPRTAESGSALVITLTMRRIESATIDQALVLSDAAVATALGKQALGSITPTEALDIALSVPVV